MSKCSAAADATGRVADLAHEALDALAAFADGRNNGFGMFADPSRQRAHLAWAARAAGTALALMDATDWPTAADLEEAKIDPAGG